MKEQKTFVIAAGNAPAGASDRLGCRPQEVGRGRPEAELVELCTEEVGTGGFDIELEHHLRDGVTPIRQRITRPHILGGPTTVRRGKAMGANVSHYNCHEHTQ
jgi:hypothetical protein